MIPRKRKGILANSFWYGMETVADMLVGVSTSVAIARVIGPELLGHFVYLIFLTTVVSRLGADGIGTAARKYMSEYLAQQNMELVRAVFFISLRLQTVLGAAVMLVGLAIASLSAAAYRPAACVLVLAIVPALINIVPSQANMAVGRFSNNVPSAGAGLAAYAMVVTLALTLGWGVTGLAAALLVRRTLEMTLRLIPVIAWMRQLPCGRPPVRSLQRRLLAFSAQNLAITVLTLVVWDRSEVLFLKAFCDIRQLAFYSVAFSVASYAALLPNVIGTAAGATLMVEYSRSRQNAAAIAQNAVLYLSVLVLPLNCGLAALAGPAIQIAYGSMYTSAIPVLAITLLLSIPKAIWWLPYTLHVAADRQAVILRWSAAAAVLNIGLDALLIPRYGAFGAAAANGAAQSFASLVLLAKAASLCPVLPARRSLAAIAFSALVMAAVALGIARTLPAAAAAGLGVAGAVLVYLACLRATRAVPPQALEESMAGLPPAARGVIRPILALARVAS